MATTSDFATIAATLVEESVVFLDTDLGSSKESIVDALVDRAVEVGRARAKDGIVAAALAREEQAPTGLPGGVAIPHCRHGDWLRPTVLFARLRQATDFVTPDGPADLLFFIGVPEDKGDVHIDILSALAKSIRTKAFRAALRGARTEAEAAQIITAHLLSAPRKRSASPDASSTSDVASRPVTMPTRIAAITACPTGIAHTYLAADALSSAADSRDAVTFTVETQGSSGTRAMSDRAARLADVLIVAADIEVTGLDRFAGRPVLTVPIKRAVNSPGAVIDDALALATADRTSRAASSPSSGRTPAAPPESTEPLGTEEPSASHPRFGIRVRNAVMTGVSYMIPFVAASGLLIALGFLVGGHQTALVSDAVSRHLSLVDVWNVKAPVSVPTDGGGTVVFERDGLWMYLGSVLFAIGGHGMNVIVAVLSAYIAYGLAGRPGIAPGFIGGAISVTVGAGFIGGLVTGILAGVIVLWLTKLRAPSWLEALMPVVVIPLLGTLAVGLLMYLVLGAPLSWLMMELQGWLSRMNTADAMIFGAVLGAMMCVDMGGMVNKSAYLFATASVSSPDPAAWKVMAAVMAAGMVPPLATSLAAFLRPRLFSTSERQNAKAGWMLGAAFISEGAIPFAARDPLRVIPSIVIGGAITGGMSMALGAATRVPHGGVFVLFAIDKPLWWLTSIVVGSIVAALCIVASKHLLPQNAESTGSESSAATMA
nr:fructose-specific PTS transporter subunit EIIC [Corynebacterium lactis]